MSAPKRKRGEGALLLSMAAAARLLGVSRNTTLKALVSNGQIRTVMRNGLPAIPRAEIERVALVGFDANTTGRIPRKRTRPAALSTKYQPSDPSTWKIRR